MRSASLSDSPFGRDSSSRKIQPRVASPATIVKRTFASKAKAGGMLQGTMAFGS
jgi:hypothetical protein